MPAPQPEPLRAMPVPSWQQLRGSRGGIDTGGRGDCGSSISLLTQSGVMAAGWGAPSKWQLLVQPSLAWARPCLEETGEVVRGERALPRGVGGPRVPHPGAPRPPHFPSRLELLQMQDLHRAPGCWDPGGGRLSGSYPAAGGHMPGHSPVGSTSGWGDSPCPAGTGGGTRPPGHHQSWGDRARDALEHTGRGRGEGPIPAGRVSLQGGGPILATASGVLALARGAEPGTRAMPVPEREHVGVSDPQVVLPSMGGLQTCPQPVVQHLAGPVQSLSVSQSSRQGPREPRSTTGHMPGFAAASCPPGDNMDCGHAGILLPPGTSSISSPLLCCPHPVPILSHILPPRAQCCPQPLASCPYQSDSVKPVTAAHGMPVGSCSGEGQCWPPAPSLSVMQDECRIGCRMGWHTHGTPIMEELGMTIPSHNAPRLCSCPGAQGSGAVPGAGAWHCVPYGTRCCSQWHTLPGPGWLPWLHTWPDMAAGACLVAQLGTRRALQGRRSPLVWLQGSCSASMGSAGGARAWVGGAGLASHGPKGRTVQLYLCLGGHRPARSQRSSTCGSRGSPGHQRSGWSRWPHCSGHASVGRRRVWLEGGQVWDSVQSQPRTTAPASPPQSEEEMQTRGTISLARGHPGALPGWAGVQRAQQPRVQHFCPGLHTVSLRQLILQLVPAGLPARGQ